MSALDKALAKAYQRGGLTAGAPAAIGESAGSATATSTVEAPRAAADSARPHFGLAALDRADDVAPAKKPRASSRGTKPAVPRNKAAAARQAALKPISEIDLAAGPLTNLMGTELAPPVDRPAPEAVAAQAPAAIVPEQPVTSVPEQPVASVAEQPVTSVPEQPAAVADRAPAAIAAQQNDPPRQAPEGAPTKPEPPALLMPAFEVERFVWPATPDSLIASAGAEFDLLGQELISGARRGRKVVLVTSRGRGEGRSTVAMALARVVAKKGQRVVLVDADFRQPAMADHLGIAAEAGLDDVLEGRLPLAEALVESTGDSVTLLAYRRPAADASAVYRNRLLAESIRQLKRCYDLVCLDGGPFAEGPGLGGNALAWAMAGIDTALLVHDVRLAAQDQVEAAGKQLEVAGVARWSVVENFVA